MLAVDTHTTLAPAISTPSDDVLPLTTIGPLTSAVGLGSA